MVDSSPFIPMGRPPNSSNSKQNGCYLYFKSSIFDGLKPWGDCDPEQKQPEEELQEEELPKVVLFSEPCLDDTGCGYNVPNEKELPMRARAVRKREAEPTRKREAEIREVELREKELTEAEIREEELREEEQIKAAIRNAELREAEIREVELRFKELREEEQIKAAIRNAELREAEIREVELRSKELREAEIREVELREKVTPRPAELREELPKAVLFSDPCLDDTADLPGWNTVVGCGYNVLNGYYADESSCLHMLFDLKRCGMSKVKLQYSDKYFKKAKDLLVCESYQTDTTIYRGNSLNEYNSSIATKAGIEGSYNFFSASIKNNVAKRKAQSTEYSFTRVQCNIHFYTMQLPSNHKEMLFEEVKDDIDNHTNLNYVFRKYGTHYLAKVVMGGHASYSATTCKSQYSSNFDIASVAAASFQALVNANVSLTAEYEEAIKLFERASTTTIQTSGGDPTLGNENLKSNLGKWSDSIKNYIKLADFAPGQMIGIWELASTLERQHQLEEHYSKYCQQEQAKYRSDSPPLTIRVVPVTNGIHSFYWASRPDNSSDSWSYFGQVVGQSGKTIVVKETEAGSGMLGEIGSWELIRKSNCFDCFDCFNCFDCFGIKGFSVWRGIPAQPFDYVVLSDFARLGCDPPTPEETKSIKAVHRSCVVASDMPPPGCFERVRISHAVNNSPTLLDGILDYAVVVTTIQREAYHLRGDCLQVVCD